MAYEPPAIVVTSSAKTASGNSGNLAVAGPADQLCLLVDCTVVSGTTPTLDITVEWSMDGTAFAVVDAAADSVAQITAAKKTIKRFGVKAPFYRVVWTIGGTTPSFTFAVSAYAVL